VYAAVHPGIGRKVAVKILRADLASNAEALSRFFNEARAANQIDNPHIVEILDFGQLHTGQPYIIMEWLEGETLGQRVEAQGPPPLARLLHLTRQVARAIVAAHQHGVVHRDLKPDNIYLVQRGTDPDFVKLVDFGIAKLALPGPSSHRTGTGVPVGTPAYMSPEQCAGDRTVDHRTDVYSLGVILYELVTGRRPFQADGLGALLLKQMTERPVPPGDLNPEIPVALERSILRMLEKEPAQRQQSMVEVLHDLGWEPSAGFRPPSLPPPPALATPPLPVVRPRTPAQGDQVVPAGTDAVAFARTVIEPTRDQPSGSPARPRTPGAAKQSGPPPAPLPPRAPPVESRTALARTIPPATGRTAPQWGTGGPARATPPPPPGRIEGLTSDGHSAIPLVSTGLRSAARPWLLALGGVAAAGLLAVAFATGRATQSSAPASEAPTTAPSVQLPSQIELRFLTEPPGGVVYDDLGGVLGRAPLTLRLARASEPRRFVVRMPGFAPATRDVVPDRDRVLDFTFGEANREPLVAAPPSAKLPGPEPSAAEQREAVPAQEREGRVAERAAAQRAERARGKAAKKADRAARRAELAKAAKEPPARPAKPPRATKPVSKPAGSAARPADADDEELK
jgi:serine/threonine-protein kinase